MTKSYNRKSLAWFFVLSCYFVYVIKARHVRAFSHFRSSFNLCLWSLQSHPMQN